MRRYLGTMFLLALLSPMSSQALSGLVIQPGQEKAVQAFLSPIGFSRPVADGWTLQKISIEMERVNLLFVHAADAATAELAIFHPDSGVKGRKMGPVIVVGDAPEEITAAMDAALRTKSKKDLFWTLPVQSGGTDASSAFSKVFIGDGSGFVSRRVFMGLVAGSLLGLLIFMEVRTRRRKKASADGESTSAELDESAAANATDMTSSAEATSESANADTSTPAAGHRSGSSGV